MRSECTAKTSLSDVKPAAEDLFYLYFEQQPNRTQDSQYCFTPLSKYMDSMCHELIAGTYQINAQGQINTQEQCAMCTFPVYRYYCKMHAKCRVCPQNETECMRVRMHFLQRIQTSRMSLPVSLPGVRHFFSDSSEESED